MFASQMKKALETDVSDGKTGPKVGAKNGKNKKMLASKSSSGSKKKDAAKKEAASKPLKKKQSRSKKKTSSTTASSSSSSSSSTSTSTSASNGVKHRRKTSAAVPRIKDSSTSTGHVHNLNHDSNESIKPSKAKKVSKLGKGQNYKKQKPETQAPSKIDALKKKLLAAHNKENMDPTPNANAPSASAKKAVQTKPSKQVKKVVKPSQVQSLKKTKTASSSSSQPHQHHQHHLNMGGGRRAVSDLYGLNQPQKKKKKKDAIAVAKVARKKKTKENVSDPRQNAALKKHEQQQQHLKKRKKKVEKPASTEKLCLAKKKVKTQTKKKELFVIGDHVRLNADKWGVVRYKGHLVNVTGIWYGVELMGRDVGGDCDGTFNEQRYFECASQCGVFVMYESIEGRVHGKELEALWAQCQADKKQLKKKGKKQKVKKGKTLELAESLSAAVAGSASGSARKSIVLGKNKNKLKPNSKSDKPLILPSADAGVSLTSASRKFKFEIPSKSKHTLALVSSSSAATAVNVSQTPKFDALSSADHHHNNREAPPMMALQLGASTTSSARDLTHILRRSRKTASLGGSSSQETGGAERRARSLSVSREDDSWMNKDAHKHDRIKENLRMQKQLDFASLMTAQSVKKKKAISGLFAQHLERSKSNAGSTTTTTQRSECNTTRLKERLKNEEEALLNAVSIVQELGFLKYIKENEFYSKMYIKSRRSSSTLSTLSTDGMDTDDGDADDNAHGNDGDADDDRKVHEFDLFDMNNMDVLCKFEDAPRQVLTRVICQAIVSVADMEIVELCNCDIDASFLEILVEYLSAYYTDRHDPKRAKISIVSLQSNPISDAGMQSLCKLIRLNHPMLTQIKLQNNRRDISTNVCQQICEALKQNEYITRFEFRFRHYEWRDVRDKIMKRNSEKARLLRLRMTSRNISV